MSRHFLPFACLFITVLPGTGTANDHDLPPGLVSAHILPGWIGEDGSRIAAIELTLEPGWKTYWRSPGDSGLPPSFDWTGSVNLASVTFHWPAPEAISSGDSVTMGYHDRLVLPFTAVPKDASQPVALSAVMDFGLCENICVPAHVELTGEQPRTDPDPLIEAALENVPRPVDHDLACTLEEISDGVRVRVTLNGEPVELAAMELKGQPDVWVSGADIEVGPAGSVVSADFVPPSGQPFPLDPDKLLMTLIGPDGAVEMEGCAPPG